jgi:hypothetical protein
MAQDLTVNIKTTSDVPQAMAKAKTAVVSFDKQIEDIQKKFSTGFKDIFLGFTAPMVLLQGALSIIQGAIAQAKQDAKEGLDLINKGETVYANAEQRKLANFIKTKQATEKEKSLVEAGKREMTQEYLKTDEGKKLLERRKAAEDALYGGTRGRRTRMSGVGALAYDDPSDPALQAQALKAFLNSEEGKKYKPIFEEKAGKDGQFKGPEGFGSVIGVGANPVIEAMTRQTEILEGIKAAIEAQAPSGGVPAPFTEKPISSRTIFNA